MLETCPCDLVNLIFPRLVTKHRPEEDSRVCVREAGSCASQPSNLGGSGELRQPGGGVQGWQGQELRTQTQGKIELAGSVRAKKASGAVYT